MLWLVTQSFGKYSWASHLHQVDVKVKGDFGVGHLSKSLMQLRDQTATENEIETASAAATEGCLLAC